MKFWKRVNKRTVNQILQKIISRNKLIVRDSLITKFNKFSHMTIPASTGKFCLAQITSLG